MTGVICKYMADVLDHCANGHDTLTTSEADRVELNSDAKGLVDLILKNICIPPDFYQIWGVKAIRS